NCRSCSMCCSPAITQAKAGVLGGSWLLRLGSNLRPQGYEETHLRSVSTRPRRVWAGNHGETRLHREVSLGLARCGSVAGVDRHSPASSVLQPRGTERIFECRRGDLNPHALAGTSPSSWRVCLFRHPDVTVACTSLRRGS